MYLASGCVTHVVIIIIGVLETARIKLGQLRESSCRWADDVHTDVIIIIGLLKLRESNWGNSVGAAVVEPTTCARILSSSLLSPRLSSRLSSPSASPHSSSLLFSPCGSDPRQKQAIPHVRNGSSATPIPQSSKLNRRRQKRSNAHTQHWMTGGWGSRKIHFARGWTMSKIK